MTVDILDDGKLFGTCNMKISTLIKGGKVIGLNQISKTSEIT